MRPWFIVALLYAVLGTACTTLSAEPARVDPPRSDPLQVVLSNTYYNGNVRVIENVWLERYTVSAEGGLPAIRKRLDAAGPMSDVYGRRFDGLTTWGLRWGFGYDQTSSSCRVRDATIELEAVITLPALEDESVLPESQLVQWQAYVEKLRQHEDGHVNIYRAGAQELSNEVLALGEMPDCGQLGSALSALKEAKLSRVAQADRNYDLETGHGAVFPTTKE
jgi:predicted secreted Zn-dependent protease